MTLTQAETEAFIRLAFARLMTAADRTGDKVANRPDLATANSIFQLVTHCLALSEYWLHHVILGAPSHRDRDAEFTASGTLTELQGAVADFLVDLPDLLSRVHAAPEITRDGGLPSGDSQDWPMTNAGITLHVIEELFQHCGHAEITADLLAG